MGKSAYLDKYSYSFLLGKDRRVNEILIRLPLDRYGDIADIVSDITANDGRIYVEGFRFLKESIITTTDFVNKLVMINIKVREVDGNRV